MPDMSEYIRNKRIVARSNANTSAEDRKFRAPTSDVSQYDPFFAGKRCGTGVGGSGVNEICNPTVKHNLFAAKVLSANPTYTTG